MRKYIYSVLLILCTTVYSHGQQYEINNTPFSDDYTSLGIDESFEKRLMYTTRYQPNYNLAFNNVSLELTEDAHVDISFLKHQETGQLAFIEINEVDDANIWYTAQIHPTITNTPEDVVFSKDLGKGRYTLTLLMDWDFIYNNPYKPHDYVYTFTIATSEAHSPIEVPVPLEAPVPVTVTHRHNFFEDIEVPDIGSYSEKKKNYIATFSSIDGTAEKGQTTVQYYDQVGRPEVTVAVQASPTGKDIVTGQTYWNDQKSRTWLPSVTTQSNGDYVDIAQVHQYAKATYNDLNPYSEVVYEKSSLNRVDKTFGPGKEWRTHNRANKTQYLTNVSSVDSLCCKKFSAVCNQDEVSVTSTENWAEGALQVMHSTNEDGKSLLVFNDIQGKKLLSRQIVHNSENVTEYYDTYYVYNALDQLLAILPPNVSSEFHSGQWSSSSSDLLNQGAYLFSYGNGFQPIAKKQPGTAWSYFIYDEEGHAILSQSGEDRAQNVWEFQIPDEFDRTVLTGVCSNSFDVWSEPLADSIIYASDSHLGIANIYEYRMWGYTMNILLETPEIFTVNYYDSYACLGHNGLPQYEDPDFIYDKLEGFGACTTPKFSGLLTCSVSKVLSNDETENKYTHSVFYYDDKNRVIQSNSSTHLDGVIEKAYFKYNYSGSLLKKRLVHKSTAPISTTEDYEYTYDNKSRLLTCTHSINGQSAVTIIDNEYDELGRVVSNKRSGNAALKESVTRNVRSWITGISSGLFKQEIHYTDGYNNSQPLFSGNICAISWNNKDHIIPECYTYEYDDLMRLTSANYHTDTMANGHYDTHYAYDKVGNITSLQRNGQRYNQSFGLVDDIDYKYSGNQLIQTEDNSSPYRGYSESAHSTVEYTYDLNGRMTKDLNRNIYNVSYYAIDKPRKIAVEEQDNTGDIYFKYSATGEKLQQKVVVDDHTRPDDSHFINDTKTKDYISNQVLMNGDEFRIMFDGGYLERCASGWDYYFFMNDYQGNVRCVADDRGNVLQRTDYYPFGFYLDFDENHRAQPYKYGGKEYIANLSLGLYDFDARMMNPTIARFTMMDSQASSYVKCSPYSSMVNNPVVFVDPDGNNPVYDTYGRHIGDTQEGFTGQIYILDPKNKLSYYDVSSMTVDDLEANKDFKTFDSMVENGLKDYAISRIIFHVLSPYFFSDIYSSEDGKNYTFTPQSFGWNVNVKPPILDKRGNEKLTMFSCYSKKIKPWMDNKLHVHKKVGAYEWAVENIQNTIIYHEWLGHMIQGNGDTRYEELPFSSPIGPSLYVEVGLNTHPECNLNCMGNDLWLKRTRKYDTAIQNTVQAERNIVRGKVYDVEMH